MKIMIYRYSENYCKQIQQEQPKVILTKTKQNNHKNMQQFTLHISAIIYTDLPFLFLNTIIPGIREVQFCV